MNDTTKRLTESYEPILSIVVYNKDKDFYLESHPIVNGKMMAGKPLDEETLKGIAKYFSEKYTTSDTIRGRIPDNVLYCEWNERNKIMVWYNPPCKRMMHFTSGLHISSGEAFQPGLLYVISNTEFSVFGLKSKSRPKAKDILYQPPYHNCAFNGKVCLGTARAKMSDIITYESVIAHYERLFWGSEFSHLAVSHNPIKGNLNTYWKAAIRNKTEFDNTVLIPTGKNNIEKLLKSLSK